MYSVKSMVFAGELFFAFSNLCGQELLFMLPEVSGFIKML